MTYAVVTEDLTKRYGSHTVVDDLALRVPAGSVYGFLGPNGAGKSTTMKMLLSLVTPSEGQIEILGRPMHRGTRREVLPDIGSLIESPPGYGHLTGRENMRVLGRMLDLTDARIAEAVDTVRLGAHLDKKVRDYSLGMKQRLGIAMALARRPRLLVLDEPTNGLDPAGIDEIRHLLRHLAAHGVTVMVSSHLLDEVERTATVLGIVSAGRLIFQGTRDELLSASTPDVVISCSAPARAVDVLGPHAAAGVAQSNGSEVSLSGLDDDGTASAVATLVRDGIGVFGVRRAHRGLDEVFRDLTADGRL
ncbi:ABC transporter ATP-binding protein [Gordonia soli]|uniref:Putative ABC transporter ATP-binding protein n=1 Tax=Gordonia soli NBRC 108243 TaxID=1223545 RepID=M0QEA3_9ACTN|nr:ATP-binding cassette domain-containing protein [Gordonia soli]GAC66913.1 putative ABC transporter ATP-binding protein [Gordonia soli NBRC 108243]